MTTADHLTNVLAATERLPLGLREHIRRVRSIAVEMAKVHGLDPEHADLAAAAHDLARNFDDSDLILEMRNADLAIHPDEDALPVLLHGPVASHLLGSRYGIEIPEVLEAVRWHSTANRGLSRLAKLIFLADKLDPTKITRYPFLDRVRELAHEDLDAALLEFLQRQLRVFLETDSLIHYASIEARNELLAGSTRNISPQQ